MADGSLSVHYPATLKGAPNGAQMEIDEVLVLRCCRSNFSEPDEELTHEIDQGRGGGLSFGVWD
jgi:hypothetical protein